MKLSRIIVLGLAICAMVMMVSCSMYVPKGQPSGAVLNVDLDKAGTNYTILGLAQGEGCETWIFGIYIGGKVAYSEAYNKAIQSKGGDFLIQTANDERYTYFLHPQYMPIYVSRCVILQGLVIKFK